MTKLRKRPAGYLTFIVEPIAEFAPTNWQHTPANYRIVEYVGPMSLLGQADSWKFLHNQAAMKAKNVQRWAIHFSLGSREMQEVQNPVAAWARRQSLVSRASGYSPVR